MEFFGNAITANDFLDNLSMNKVITFVKINKSGRVIRYTVAKTVDGRDKIYGETYEFTVDGRDNTDKLIESGWYGKNMLKSFISYLNIEEWNIYAK